MENLLESWNLIESQIDGKKICIFLDYDGTLTPITSSPANALLEENTKNILLKLSANSRCQLAIISGREIMELKRLVDIPSLWYSGNHGLEIETEHVQYKKSLPPAYLNLLRVLYAALNTELRLFKGVLVEDKGVTLSVHYRNLHPGFEFEFLDKFQKITDFYMNDESFKIVKGKMVFEIRPNVNWNKGNAVLRLLTEIGFDPKIHVPFYFGDDATDEDAFKVISEFGITTHIGSDVNSNAAYFLPDVNSMEHFLTFLLNYLESDSNRD